MSAPFVWLSRNLSVAFSSDGLLNWDEAKSMILNRRHVGINGWVCSAAKLALERTGGDVVKRVNWS
jgi:hypothetical protein